MSKTDGNKSIPKLRFLEFMNEAGWSEKPLDKFCLSISSGKDKNTIGGEYELYGSTGIIGKAQNASYDGDFILVARVGANAGRLNKVRGKFGVTDNTLVIDLINKDLIDFIHYSLDKVGLNKLVFGSGQPLITGGQLKNLLLSAPTSEQEQQKIATCLSSLDEVITVESKKFDLLKEHKKVLLQNLLPQEGETVPKFRFKEFEDSEEWAAKKLGDVCKMQAGKFVSASEIKEVQDESLFPCYGGNGLRGYVKSFNYTGTYSLIGRQGALCGNVNLAQGKFYATEHAVVVTPEKDANTHWLFYMLGYLKLNQYATGQAQPGLSIDNLEKVELKIPIVIQEQQKIASCLSSIDDLINNQNQKVKALKLHKQGLLQGLFPNVNKVIE